MKKSKKTIRVVHMVPLGTGGITSLVLNLHLYMNAQEIAFDFLTFRNQTEPNEARALRQGGRKLVADSQNIRNPIVRAGAKFIRTMRVLRQAQAEIMHINASTPYDLVVGISARLAGVHTVIFHSHNAGAHKGRLHTLLMRPLRLLVPLVSDCNLACSEPAAQYLFPRRVLRRGDYRIIKNGIRPDLYAFCPAVREEYRKQYHVSEKMVVGHIGRFVAQKNHAFVLQIFEQLQKLRSDSVLFLIGTGELEAEIRAQAQQRGLSGQIVFLGATDQVPQFMQMMDVLLLPSFFEGLPVVGVEAQAADLPLLVSDTVTRELAITEQITFLPLSAGAEHWARCALECAAHVRTVTTQRIRDAGFDIADTAAQLTALYRSLSVEHGKEPL